MSRATPIGSAGGRRLSALVFLAIGLALCGPTQARAQDAGFQAFFFDVCGAAPGGTLAARCAETPGATGDLSGDSESSLNPDQGLALNEASLGRAMALNKEVQKRLEDLRDDAEHEDAGEEGETGGGWDRVRPSLLANGRVTWFDRDSTSRQRGVEGTTWGPQVGADFRPSERVFVGGLFSYERTDSTFDSDQPGVNFAPPKNDGETEANAFGLTLFGSYDFGERWYVDGSLGGTYTDYTFTRRAVFQESTRATPQTNVRGRQDTDGWEINGSAGAGYRWSWEALTLSPYLRLAVVHSRVDSYREDDESGSGLAMEFDDTDQTSLTSVVGLRASYAWSTRWGVLVPQGRAEWEHEYLRSAEEIDTRYLLDVAGTDFPVRGDSPDRDYANLGASLLLLLPNGWMPFVDYEALVGHSFLDRHRLSFGLRAEF